MSLIFFQKDLAVLADLRTDKNDRLDVVRGHLNLVKSKYNIRWSGRQVTPRPTVLADYLDNLIKNTAKAYFQSIQASKNDSPEYYEIISDFNRQIKSLKNKIGDLQYAFRDDFFGSNAVRYHQLFNLSCNLQQEVKKFKSSLKKPPVIERPIKHLDYNERTPLTSVGYFSSERTPVKETVAAAKKALLLAQEQSKLTLSNECKDIIKSFGFRAIVTLIGAGFASAMKIVLWNPFEWLIFRKVKTESPLQLVFQEMIHDRHLEAYQYFTNQLLHRPIITEEVVNAFVELSVHADCLDLKNAILGSEDVSELAPFLKENKNPGAIPLDVYLKVLKEKMNRFVTVDTLKRHYKIISKLYKFNANKKSMEDFIVDRIQLLIDFQEKPNKGNPSITPKSLQKLVASAASSPTCREIKLSRSLLKSQHVHDFLNQHSFQLKKKEQFESTYERDIKIIQQ